MVWYIQKTSQANVLNLSTFAQSLSTFAYTLGTFNQVPILEMSSNIYLSFPDVEMVFGFCVPLPVEMVVDICFPLPFVCSHQSGLGNILHAESF